MEKLLEFIKLSPKYLFGISVVSGILLFSSDKFISMLGMEEFLKNYRQYLGVVFLISLIFTINEIFINGISNIKKKYTSVQDKKSKIERLNKLTIEEKDILCRYIFNQTRTCKLPIQSGIVSELVHYGILYRSANVGDLLRGFSYNIQPWAWDYLNEHEELLHMPIDKTNF